MIKKSHQVQTLIINLSDEIGCLGALPSLLDCDFWESYGVFPWDKRITSNGVFCDHGWKRDIFEDLDHWQSEEIEDVRESVSLKRPRKKKGITLDVPAQYLEFHHAGIPYLGDHAAIFYFIAWFNNYQMLGFGQVSLSQNIIDKVQKCLMECDQLSPQIRLGLKELLGTFSIEEPLDFGELLVRDKLYALQESIKG